MPGLGAGADRNVPNRAQRKTARKDNTFTVGPAGPRLYEPGRRREIGHYLERAFLLRYATCPHGTNRVGGKSCCRAPHRRKKPSAPRSGEGFTLFNRKYFPLFYFKFFLAGYRRLWRDAATGGKAECNIFYFNREPYVVHGYPQFTCLIFNA